MFSLSDYVKPSLVIVNNIHTLYLVIIIIVVIIEYCCWWMVSSAMLSFVQFFVFSFPIFPSIHFLLFVTAV